MVNYDVELCTSEQLKFSRESQCEVCGYAIDEHKWVALDINGFVAYCNTTLDMMAIKD